MTARLLIQWDPEIDGPFRRRFERALRELQVEHADITAVDPDDDTHPIVVIASPHSRPPAHGGDALVVLGGPGEARHANGALRLEASDIDNRTRRWTQTAERLGARLNRPGLARFAEADSDPDALKSAALAFPADPLARDAAISLQPAVIQQRLAQVTQLATEAKQALATSERERADAIRDMKRAEAEAIAAQAQIDGLTAQVERLAALAESTAYALASVPERDRPAVAAARDHAWRARLAASRALEAAAAYPDALRWSGITYSGETKNGHPHGHGVMTFSDATSYRGVFDAGHRTGHGLALNDGHSWLGQFANNEACGHGLLETATLRFEGEVASDSSGAPRRVRGHTWKADGGQIGQPITLQLKAPHQS